jgi:hypothetical protein
MTRSLPRHAAAIAAVALALSARAACAHGVPPKIRWFAASEANLSFLGQFASGEAAIGSVAYRLGGGFRVRAFDLFLAAEHGFWRDDQGTRRLRVQTLDVGLGMGVVYFDGRIRSELSSGPSILLTRSQLDAPGTTGFFFDFRPAGYRWRFGRAVASLYPLTFAFVAPVVDGIPLVYISYRTALIFDLEF